MKESRIQNIQSMIEAGNSLVASNGNGNAASDIWKSMVAGESIRKAPQAFTTLNDAAATQYAASFPGKRMSHAASVASAMILAASQDPATMITKVAAESSNPRYNSFMSAAIPGSQYGSDYDSNPFVASEYYTDKDLDKNLGLTWALNVRALETQSQFAERLFPTITVDTNDVGITIRTKVTMVTRGILNALLAKDSVIDDRKPLHNALTDHRVLQDDAIRIVPYVMQDGGNAASFVAEDIVPNETVRLGRCPEYPTNYLNIKETKGNLFRLSAHPGITAEGYDESDEIAPGAALGSLLLSVRKPSDSVAEGHKIKLQTKDMQFAAFQRPAEGDGRELTLNFRHTVFALNGKTVDYLGNPIPALDALKQNKYTLRYVITLNISVFTGGQQSGTFRITGQNLEIEGLMDATGTSVATDSGMGKTILDNIKLEVLGWKFDGTRTNENRRTQGLMLDPIWETENYKLQYGSPIMTKSPVGMEYDDAERLDDLVSAVNIRNESLAITQTLGYTAAVKQAFENMVTPWDKPAIRGLGRMWVAPWYEESEFNVGEIVQSLETKDALINARQALLQRIGDQVTRAIQDSRYMPALRLLTGRSDATPRVIIATDEPTAAMLLLVQGETRLLGDRYEYEVITTNDDRWRTYNEADGSWTRRLQWFLSVDGVEDGTYCVLNWGNHFWSPIMVTNINIQRNGATSKELAAQPRNAHVNHCPITGVHHITGITKMVSEKLAYRVQTTQTAAGDGNLGGLDGAAPETQAAPVKTAEKTK
ncbi:MAG: hypothetical protein ACRDBQ_18720 [Shewanella sp.]